MEETRFSTEHTWARLDDDDRVTVGISDYAQEEWGEILEVLLPEEGEEVVKDEPFGQVRTGQRDYDVFAPVTGEVTEVNREVQENPEIINEGPLTDGWLIRIAVASTVNFDELLNEDEYNEYLKDEMELQEDREEDEEEDDEVL